jgi:hypothetical protein
MTTFNLVAGICGIVAFGVLCRKGIRLLKKETHVFLARDPARSLHRVKDICDKHRLDWTSLGGNAPGVRATGRAYKIRSAREECEREEWLSPMPVSKMEFRPRG